MTKKEIRSIVNIPLCCKGKGNNLSKSHKKCREAVDRANGVVEHLQQLADGKNDMLRARHESTKAALHELNRFTRIQYRRGEKIVQDAHLLEDKIRTKDNDIQLVSNEVWDTVEKNKELKTKIKHQSTEIRRLEKDVTKVKNKYDKLLDKCEKEKKKLQEDLKKATAVNAVLKRQDTGSQNDHNQSKTNRERQQIELKLKFKMKGAHQ